MTCPDEPLIALASALDDVLGAYARVDAEAFDRAARSLDPLLACQTAVLPVDAVAEVHRTKALVHFAQGDEVASRASLTVARSLDADWALDDALFPEGHPLRAIYQEALTSFRTDTLADVRGRWFVDGLPSTVAPLGYPFVLQGVDEADRVVFSGYVADITSVPALPVLAPDARDVVLRVAVAGFVRAAQGQQAEGAAGFDGGSEAGWSGGPLLRVEADPLPFLGLLLDLATIGAADPRHGGVGGEVRGVVAVGPSVSTGSSELRPRVRAGAAVDTLVGWGHETPLPEVVPGAVVGAGVDLARPGWRAGLFVDGTLNGAFAPYAWRVDGSVGIRLRPLLAVVGGAVVGHRGLDFASGEGGAARRTEDEQRLWVGLAVWR